MLCSGKYFIQKFGYGFVFRIYINSAPYIDTLFVVYKQIVCLGFNLGKYLPYSQLRIGDTYFGVLRVAIPAVCLECYKQKKE